MVDVAIPRPLVSGSHLFGVSPEEYMSWISGRWLLEGFRIQRFSV